MKAAKYDYSLVTSSVESGSKSSITSGYSDNVTPSKMSDVFSDNTTLSSRIGSSIITPGTLNRSSFITPGTRSGSRSSVSFNTPRSGSYSAGSTPGSGMKHSRGFQSSAILALVEGRGLARGEIGMAYIDLKRPVLFLSQFPDSQTYVKVLTKLLLIQPMEIILPNTVCDGGMKTKLYQLLAEQFDEATLTTVQRKYFNESKGLEYIHHLCAAEFNSVEVEISTKYYCLAASAALLKYVEFIQNMVYAPNSLRVCFKGSDQTAMIDVTTVKNLELLTNARDPTSNQSLYGILNYTKTIGGARLLRSNILEPPSSSETIRLRQDCLQELTENEEMFYGLEAVLKRFLDIDHLISLVVTVPKRDTQRTAESTITNVIHLKHVLHLVDPLQKAIEGTSNNLLKAFYQVLDDPRFKIIIDKIKSVVHDDTHFQKGALYMRAQKCFCIKSGLNAMLDIQRQLYTEVIDDISALTKQLTEKYGLPVKSAFSASRGFYLQLYISGNTVTSDSETPTGQHPSSKLNVEDLPREFLKVTKHRHTFSFTTVDLIKLNTRANDSLDEIYVLSHSVLKEMLGGIREHIGCLYRLAECVAMLDMLHSFSHLCTISDYTCPEFTDTLAIKQGRHPILDKIAYEPPVPNNAYVSSGSNFVIITGPNMSGKSTFLRQIALLQIMAQIGCFIPAEYASFRVADRIYSRIGSDDDIETNASTFMVEMREINYILQNVSDSSLIIVDELGRGTSAEEGMGLCYAICEQLLATAAYTFLATHFLELNHLSNCYPNVEVYHFQLKMVTDATGDPNPNTHQLIKGIMEQTNYGLELAKMSCLPAEVLEEASTIAARLTKEKLLKDSSHPDDSSPKVEAHEIGRQLVQVARNSLLDTNGLRSYLKYLKNKYYKDTSASTV